ncbi:MAG: iron-containing alcohol dehydrogenase [Rubrobacter sp.]|nr:iron-containing alcohol dehydrogenase [Rubrobacter sp.]
MMRDGVELHSPPDVVVRGGVSEELGEFAARLGLSRVLVVTDPFMYEDGPVRGLVHILEKAGVKTSVYREVQADPTVANVEAALGLLREHEADGVVAIGGGSPLDTGKAASIMATNDGGISPRAARPQQRRLAPDRHPVQPGRCPRTLRHPGRRNGRGESRFVG